MAVAAVLFLSVMLSVFLVVRMVVFSADTVVVFNGTTFEPNELTIAYGEKVTFTNASDGPFWPASNLHPTHAAYSLFDPKEPIDQGGSWSFTFLKAGTWGFHDHIQSTAKGVITVRDQNGNIVTAVDCTQDTNKSKCWEDSILTALDSGGVGSAFDVFKDYYQSDPEFVDSCHDIAHLIGERSYQQFAQGGEFDLSAASKYCGYGYFHGFMSTLLLESGNVERARNFCAFVDESLSAIDPSADSSCYHGIGHGAVDGGDPRSWGDAAALVEPALELCSNLTNVEYQKRDCGNGVFDAIGIAMLNHDYGLSFAIETVYDLCEKTEVLFKAECYDKANSLIAQSTEYNIDKSLTLLNTMEEDAYYNNALVSLAATFGRVGKPNQYDSFIDTCHSLDLDTQGYCISGFAIGLVELGPLNKEYINGMEFCKSVLLEIDEKQLCFASVIENSSLVFSEEEMKAICTLVSREADTSTMKSCIAAL